VKLSEEGTSYNVFGCPGEDMIQESSLGKCICINCDRSVEPGSKSTTLGVLIKATEPGKLRLSTGKGQFILPWMGFKVGHSPAGQETGKHSLATHWIGGILGT